MLDSHSVLRQIYGTPLGLLTDLYQLTMAHAYWKTGGAESEAVFHLFFRSNPFGGGYAISAGLDQVIDYFNDYQFDAADVAYLSELRGNDDKPLFEPGFLTHLKELQLQCDLDAIPEGTVVFPHQPLLRVRGPLIQCQLLETALLNIINFQTLVATKASRITSVCGDDPVLEFGLRRAQGIDGALSASRAAFIGGCAATSNVLAGKLFGIPVKGTHAHSWVMCFDNEREAFETYADAMPNNCVFLVDTYDTLQGVRHAIDVGQRLKERGHQMVGIRLDSGDLAYLSIEARKLLDEAGFHDAAIVASNDLDEQIIRSLKEQGAQISVWGVGTKLSTAFDQPALGGVYKLSAIKPTGGQWQPKTKLSEQAIKTSTPGILQVRRYFDDQGAQADMIFNELDGASDDCVMIDPLDPTRRKTFASDQKHEDLLTPVFRNGTRVCERISLAKIRTRREQQLQQFHSGIRRHTYPHQYPVGLETKLNELKTNLILQAR
ncbi:Nicotinate phosphoribosyltransferase pncB2 [Stieleria bergensis]|uniref:Nicotinate phosphoribosyltransferase n=1 Tax=Stieleria bergensis TaxID=2528025 RepID=A0A517SZD0_9BACT|nr:Nicotinate phosphoribosyltransferase pncB2 [Planctomycetes bacterium SV_7m_r]